MFGQLIGLRSIAQVIHRNAAAEINVLERQAGFVMNRHQMGPHALERFRERLDVRSLRANVNVNTADVNQLGILQATPESVEHFGRRDAEL